MLSNRKTIFFSNLVLMLLDNLIDKFDNLATTHANQMIVMLSLVELIEKAQKQEQEKK